MTRNQFTYASQLCYDELGFLIDPDEDVELARLVRSTTTKRFIYCVKRVKTSKPGATMKDRYNTLLAELELNSHRVRRVGVWKNV